jgi:hypothetical protein
MTLQNKSSSNATTAAKKNWSQEQIALMKTKKIAATHKIKHWIEIFDTLAQYDETIDKKEQYSYAFAVIFGLLAVLTICFFALFEQFERMPFSFIFIVLAILCLRQYKILKNNNIENHFRLYALPLFHLFQYEASPDTQLVLDMDFNMPEQKSYLIHSIPNTKEYYPKIDINFYKINWLNCDVQFADKTQLQITITDLIRVSDVKKRNPRGKIKHKTKRAIKQIISIKVLFDKTKYQPKPTQAQLLIETDNCYCAKLKSVNLIKSVNTNINYDEYTDMNPLLSVIAQAYAAVKPI